MEVNKKNESFTDFLCPICLQILIEPVQMPCKHELCMDCFKQHVYNTSLTCPMCRLRISVWARKNTKTNSLVNTDRWDLIKKMFPERVKRRLDGLDDLDSSFDEYYAPVHIISSKGELQKEYEAEVKKLQEEKENILQANIQYIEKLQKEEYEERLRQEELDRATAEKLQQKEMYDSGIRLKSPSAHQEQLLALFKPKSPMKLRKRKVILSDCNVSKRKQCESIRDYFYDSEGSKAQLQPSLCCTNSKTEKKEQKEVSNQFIKKVEYQSKENSVSDFNILLMSENTCITKSKVDQIDSPKSQKTLKITENIKNSKNHIKIELTEHSGNLKKIFS
ncbi:E3 ubiquitin-protein ligase rnf168 [Hydra vulgaris]|uniref:RING-type E3 ubiquitin transferase n=1 Tax=Hydra vulgaris TaxID=6087 RepID=T2MAE0_HYDVU|nr:E3 ubiquitin-protein ligase rnf168 [Hydra vulgaris]